MKLKPVDRIPSPQEGRKGKSMYYNLVRQFLQSGHKYVEVTEMKAKPKAVYQNLVKTVRTHNFPVKVHIRKDRVFLERLDSS